MPDWFGGRKCSGGVAGRAQLNCKRFRLTGNEYIGDDGAEALLQMLKTNTTLEELFLGLCGIGDRGARALGEALKANTTLREILLHSNNVTDDGAEALAEALRWNESLTRLDLSKCQLTDVGASTLSSALRESNSTLTRLDLDYNHQIENCQEITVSIMTLLEENQAVPASAERRARCLLFCCLKLAPTAHEHAVPSIGAVPVPVMQYAVEHAGKLHVAKRFERDAVDKGQLAFHRALAAQVQQNALQQQQNAQQQEQITQLKSGFTKLNAAAGASLASHASTLSSGDEDDGEPANKRAKTA